MNTSTEKDAQHYLLYLLSKREYSAFDLKNKLLEKGYDPVIAEQAIAKAQENKWQSDERYAEAFVNTRITQGKGPVRIVYELEQHGIASNIIEAIVDFRDSCWLELAKNVLRKKGTPTDQYQTKIKAMKFLQYRGFTSDQIRKVIKE